MTVGVCGFALQFPGPSHKTGYNYHTTDLTHDKTGVTIHTAEYDVAQWDEQVLYNALFSGREASWHFTITKEGWLFQHYPVDAVTWHCGYEGNLWTVGIECEGYAPNKISGPQYGLLVKLLRWLQQDRRWPNDWIGGSRADHNLYEWSLKHSPTLWEHNEIQEAYTDCQVFSRDMVALWQLLRDLKEEPMEIQDDFAELREHEMGWMDVAESARQVTQYQQLRTISTIRHSQHESAEVEMESWKALSSAYDAEVAAIREAQERCRVHGRPG